MENFKDIVVKDRKFRLNKMDARTGSYMLFRLVNILTPLFKGVDLDKIAREDEENDKENAKSFLDSIDLSSLASSLFSLKEDEFRFIQDNCLHAVEEVLPARNAPVLDKNGNYGVSNIEFDVALLMNLTVQSLIFQVKGFFNADLLSSLTKGSNSFPLSSEI